MTAIPPSSPRAALVRTAALALTEPQRAALANELLLSLSDPACLQAVARLGRNATTVGATMSHSAFITRDAQRRVMG